MRSALVIVVMVMSGCAALDCTPVGFNGATDPPHCKAWRLAQEAKK